MLVLLKNCGALREVSEYSCQKNVFVIILYIFFYETHRIGKEIPFIGGAAAADQAQDCCIS